MKILLVSATRYEVQPLIDRFNPPVTGRGVSPLLREATLEADLLISGIGILSTAFSLGMVLAEARYDLAVNAGFCGAYPPGIRPGEVLHVTTDSLPEPGVAGGGLFRSLFETGLASPDAFPFSQGRLVNTLVPAWKTVSRLPQVSGNTVQTMRTDPREVKRLLERSPADVETMEGAAFLYGCLSERIPSFQLRAVSNHVGERDKSRWETRLAVKHLHEVLTDLLEEIAGV